MRILLRVGVPTVLLLILWTAVVLFGTAEDGGASRSRLAATLGPS
jgi:hypothetical protein